MSTFDFAVLRTDRQVRSIANKACASMPLINAHICTAIFALLFNGNEENCKFAFEQFTIVNVTIVAKATSMSCGRYLQKVRLRCRFIILYIYQIKCG